MPLDSIISSISNVYNMSLTLRIGQVYIAAFHKDNLLRNGSQFLFYKAKDVILIASLLDIMESTEFYGTGGIKSKCENSLP